MAKAINKANTNKLNSAHDKIFQATFQIKERVVDFLKSRLDKHMLAHVELGTLNLENTSFIDDVLKRRYSDILYSVKIKNAKGYFYFLLEQQTKSDRYMVVRLLEYMMHVWRHHENKYKDGKLPIVYPLVIYSGKAKYPYARKLSEGFSYPELIAKMFNHPFLIDLRRNTKNRIMRDGGVALSEIFMCQDNFKALWKDKKVADKLRQDKRLYLPLYKYALARYDDPPEEITEKFNNLNPNEQNDIMTAEQQIEQRGIKIGKQLGEQRGIKLGEQRLALNLMAEKMPKKKIASLLDMSIEELTKLVNKKL